MSIQKRPRLSFLKRLLLVELAIGLGVTLKHLFRKNVTQQYPKERHEFRPRFRGLPRLRWDEDGEHLCVGCLQCSDACPTNCITVTAQSRTKGKGKEPKLFLLDYERCCVCGICEEVCPTEPKAIYMSHDYELAKYDRAEFMTDMDLLYKGHDAREYKK